LNKYLAKCGVASRRESDNLIKSATTIVNGVLTLDPAFNVGNSDKVEFDGRIIKINYNRVVLMLNKPKGIISTMKDTHGRKTVMEFISSKIRVNPVGRLDQDSTGLILFTNDGDLHNYLTHPKHQIPKEYEALVESKLSELQVDKISKGVFIGDGEYGKANIIKQIKIKSKILITLRLFQGKKREIRRIFRRMNVDLFSLNRTKFGNLDLGPLKTGEFRSLTNEEILFLSKSKK
tara:strand:- start:272 stop:973 length:702 start_codon:yes stop_codon:yes gene_type:complete